MKREFGEDWVDRVVDGECSEEEKRALEAEAARNPEIRSEIRAALRIREWARRSAGATVPPEFSVRLRRAIERSDFWEKREVAKKATLAESRRTRFGGRRVVWAATGAAVAFAAVALAATGVGNGRQTARRVDESTAEITKIAEITKNANPENVGDTTKNAPPVPLLRRPENDGEAPEPPVAAPSDFYTRRAVDVENPRRFLMNFLKICRENGVAYEKINGDFELTLLETSPEARREIRAWLDSNAPEIAEDRGEAKLTERWDENDSEVRDARISFFVVETR